VLVLDLDQPSGSALPAIGLLVKEFPATGLVVMSSRCDHRFVRAAIAAGARGYVPCIATARDLTLSIRRAASAAATLPVPPDTSRAEPPPTAGPRDLSPREAEVLGLIAMGHTNAEIGRRLALSVRTIETHRSRIRHKLDRPTRAELVEYAFARGMERSRP
jgi:two-component system response regulator NreC